jgi:hypothetical protein
MAGLKLKFKENQHSFDEREEESLLAMPSSKMGIPRPVLLEGNGEEQVVKAPKKRSNKYFYKVSNHHELFKIGSSFFEDYKRGVKSFAVGSTGYQASQQNSILGLASFFDHKEDIKIGIVSDNLKEGAFSEIVSISKKSKLELGDTDEPCTYYSFYKHFDFFDLDELIEISNSDGALRYEEVFDSLVDEYDIIFWDVPDLSKIKKDSEKYFPVIMKFESLSIIVAQSLSNSKDIKDIKNFFIGYGISLKGLLFDTKLKENMEIAQAELEKKPWWRVFG